jgi:hypothetical protein
VTSTLPQSSQPSLAARVRNWMLGGAAVPAPRVLRAGGDLDVIRLDGAGPTALPADELRERWKAASLNVGWASPTDWWDPACDALTEALVDTRDPLSPANRLGRARAELGCPAEEAIDDLVALWHCWIGVDPPVAVVRALTMGWAEAGLEPIGVENCLDPVTRLATRSYLEARLSELYRDARPAHPAEAYTLIVVDVDESSALAGLGRICRVAEVMRRTFTNGETLARLAPGRVVALCASGVDVAARLIMLEGLLNGGHDDDLSPAVWIESLPRTFGPVHGLLTDLSR